MNDPGWLGAGQVGDRGLGDRQRQKAASLVSFVKGVGCCPEDTLKDKNKTQRQVLLSVWFRKMFLAVKGQRDSRGRDQGI